MREPKTAMGRPREFDADTALAAQMAEQPVRGVVYTSISQDGTFAGPDVERTLAVAEVARRPVILSGGIGSGAHVDVVAGLTDRGIAGVIIGKAWYEGRVDLAALLQRHPQDGAGW